MSAHFSFRTTWFLTLTIWAFLWLHGGGVLLSAQFRDVSDSLGFPGDGKAAFVDFDADGWVDLYAGGRLFRNDSGLRLDEVVPSQLPSGEGIWGDFDNDGFPDLFVFNSEGTLHRNQGDGRFQAVPFPKMPTINSRAAVWSDINNDGRLDLYVGGYELWREAVHPDAIYFQQSNGTFFEHWRSPTDACYSARGVTAADFDEDGQVEIYVSNYRLQPNVLWDFRDSASMTDVAVDLGVAGIPSRVIEYTGGIHYPISGHTIGSAWGDLDNDSHLDLFVGNFSHPPAEQNRPQFLRNRGPEADYRFEDLSERAGLAWQESFASPALGDFDNDGDLDLYFTTVYPVGSGGIQNFPVLYRNEGNFRFVDVTADEGLAKLGPTYQAAWGDVDNDGDLDLCSNGKLFRNEGKRGNWIQLTLRGDGKSVNRSAIGAVARIRIGDMILTRHVEAGTGEGNQNEARLHFGLGVHTDPVDVDITWPGNIRQQVTGLPINHQHLIDFQPHPWQ